MNKQEAIVAMAHQEQIISLSKLRIHEFKRIIDAPEPKTGRVMSVDDLFDGQTVYRFNMLDGAEEFLFSKSHADVDNVNLAIKYGRLFHDADTCNKFGEHLELEQELRRAQIADGGEGEFKGIAFVLNKHGDVKSVPSDYVEKVAFRTPSAKLAFLKGHTDDQLRLLIRGV